MMPFFFALLTHAESGDAVVARNSQAMRRMPTFEVQYVSKVSLRPDIQGDLILDQGKRLYCHSTAPGIDYKISITPQLYREVDERVRMYDEYPYVGGDQLYPSRISPIQKTMPMWLTAHGVQNLIPRTTKFTYVKKSPVNGRGCDHIRAVITGPMGGGTMDIDIAADGLVYRMDQVTTSPEGSSEQIWEFKKYTPLKSLGASRFTLRVPDGFVPYALNVNAGPAKIGTKLNLSGFVDSKTGKAWPVPTERPLIVLVAGSDSAPSSSAVRQFSKWQAQIRQAGGTLAIVSEAASAAEADGLPYNPSQKSIEQLAAPATPTMYLVDRAGKVVNLWMGFDSHSKDKLLQDILKALSASR